MITTNPLIMTAHSFIPTFRKQDVLSYLEDQDIVSQSNIRNFHRNEYLLQPHRRMHHIYIVIKGRVKVGTYGDEQKEMIKKVVNSGGIIGEFTLNGKSVSKDYAIAMEATQAYVFTLDEFTSLLMNHPQFFYCFMQRIGEQLLETEQRLEHLVFKDSRSRIIHFLEKLVVKNGQRIGYEVLVQKFFTHQEIANQTATSRQTVTTVLNDLRNKNILTFNRRRLLVRDLDLLRAEIN